MPYDRKTGRLLPERQFGAGPLQFLYKTVPGRLCLRLFASRRWFSSLATLPYRRPASRNKITPFIAEYGIDMADYPRRDYTSFDDFFTRQLLPGRRPFSADPSTLCAPADAKLLALPVGEDLRLHIKGAKYTLGSLLADETLAREYRGGDCLVFRLTVDDYHRFHYIDEGRVLKSWELPGRLHTVGPLSDGLPVFALNHRVCSLLETEHFGRATVVEVGALLVGRIHLHPARRFARGQERGWFAYGGSTIVLLFEAGRVQLHEDIRTQSAAGTETIVHLGEAIGTACRKEETPCRVC